MSFPPVKSIHGLRTLGEPKYKAEIADHWSRRRAIDTAKRQFDRHRAERLVTKAKSFRCELT
jgi:hypothetical protein